MKVVLFCGGLGLRLRELSDSIPKPMVPIGYRPVLWHVMRYYAHFGHKDFILCLGHKGDVVKDYFLRYSEALSNDFVMSNGGRQIELLSSDISDWRITFIDTGLHANVGQRLLAARKHLVGEDIFLVNYGDTLTDAHLPDLIENFRKRDKVAAFICVRPAYSFHVVSLSESGVVAGVQDAQSADIWINGGYFIFRKEVFDYIGDGEELIGEPFARLIEKEQLIAYRHEGFWAPMDTLKERDALEQLFNSGHPPWAVWQRQENT